MKWYQTAPTHFVYRHIHFHWSSDCHISTLFVSLRHNSKILQLLMFSVHWAKAVSEQQHEYTQSSKGLQINTTTDKFNRLLTFNIHALSSINIHTLNNISGCFLSSATLLYYMSDFVWLTPSFSALSCKTPIFIIVPQDKLTQTKISLPVLASWSELSPNTHSASANTAPWLAEIPSKLPEQLWESQVNLHWTSTLDCEATTLKIWVQKLWSQIYWTAFWW